MKKNKFLIIFIIVVILMIFLWVISRKKGSEISDNGIIEEKQEVILKDYIEHLENGALRNTSEKLKESKEIEGVKINNIKITSEDLTTDKVTLMFDVQNISNTTKDEKEIVLVMYDFEHKEIGKAELSLPNLNISQIVTIELDMTAEFINTYDISVIEDTTI